MLKRKDESIKIVEAACICERVPRAAGDTQSDADTLPSPSAEGQRAISAQPEGGKRRGGNKRSLFLKLALFGLLVPLVVLAGNHALNSWIDASPFNVALDYSRVNWVKKVERMSPLEAAILQKKLEWRVARGEKMGGDDAAYARLGQFYVIKHEPKLAIAALEKAVKFWGGNPNDVFNPVEGSWRWKLLVELYIQEGDYKSAAAMFDNSAKLDSNDRTFGGDGTWYYETAADVYAKVGSTEKAERAKEILQRIELMPRGFDTDKNSMTRLRELRESAFDFAAVCLREDKPKEALHVLFKLFSDRQALRLKVDKPQFIAAANMMISVAQVQDRDWSAAEKSFPRALRLAAKERTLARGAVDVKPTLYRAYAAFLEHQGKSLESKQYVRKAEVAASAPQEDVVFYEETGKTEGPPPPDYDDNDLYPPELLK